MTNISKILRMTDGMDSIKKKSAGSIPLVNPLGSSNLVLTGVGGHTGQGGHTGKGQEGQLLVVVFFGQTGCCSWFNIEVNDSLGRAWLDEKIEPIRKHAACEMTKRRIFDVDSMEDFGVICLIPLLPRLGVFFCRSMV